LETSGDYPEARPHGGPHGRSGHRRSPEEVFDYFSDPANEPEWNIKMKAIERLTDGPVGVGTPSRMEFTSGPAVISECVRFERTDRVRGGNRG
jgi:hypothetical protein